MSLHKCPNHQILRFHHPRIKAKDECQTGTIHPLVVMIDKKGRKVALQVSEGILAYMAAYYLRTIHTTIVPTTTPGRKTFHAQVLDLHPYPTSS